jgi:hypothetical protein
MYHNQEISGRESGQVRSNKILAQNAPKAVFSNLGLCETECDARNVKYFVSVCTYNGYDKVLKALE